MIPQTLLSKIIRKNAGQLLTGFLATSGEAIRILDADGIVLVGAPPVGRQRDGVRLPIVLDGSVSGWVAAPAGSKWAAQVADLVTYLLAQEAESRALAGEVLDKYRELHLLYRLSERLIASPKPEIIGQMALSEVCSASQSTRGLVILTHPDEGEPEIIAAYGFSCSLKPEAFNPDRLIGRVISSGTAELSNHQPTGDYIENAEEETVSLMCAPLKTDEQVFGVFFIATSARPFAAGDLKLLNAIAMQTAPAIEIAHLHQLELEKAWLERDLEMAQKVQSGLLPSQMPILPGWQLAAFWQPAHIVSGDLYDFIHLPDGKLCLVVADVTDKGMPAALLMANARSTLRGVAASAGRSGWDSPARLLAQVNDVLSEEIPMDMFVTCLLVVLDPKTGHVRYANAGHNPPYLCNAQGALELRATGIPLGLFPDLEYEEKEVYLQSGDSLLMYSDGLVEAHDPQRVMFGFPRLHQILATLPEAPRLDSEELLHFLMEKLTAFTGPGWEQEDDITMFAVRRS